MNQISNCIAVAAVIIKAEIGLQLRCAVPVEQVLMLSRLGQVTASFAEFQREILWEREEWGGGGGMCDEILDGIMMLAAMRACIISLCRCSAASCEASADWDMV